MTLLLIKLSDVKQTPLSVGPIRFINFGLHVRETYCQINFVRLYTVSGKKVPLYFCL